MVTLLEFIFQGFFEWVYSLILEIWNYFSSALLGVMSLDFAYLKAHIPVMGDIQQALLAVGWALLLGNLVFQAVRSMVSGLGFEGEDPKLLFARTFTFGFLLLASPQICEMVLGITSSVIALLEVPDAIDVQLVDGSAFGVLGASWILVIIFDLITMFMVLSLLLEVAERYMVLAMLTLTAPLAFAMGGSESTSEIFAGWCRMFGSMCLLMATNIIFFKMLLSVVSTVPSFPDVFLWMVLIVSIVKVAKKADEIITRIGLNPAITGNRSTLPGMIAYTVFRTALSMVTKGAATSVGGALGLTGKAAAGIGKGAGTAFRGTGAAAGAAGSVAGGVAQPERGGCPRYGGGRSQTQQGRTQQEYTKQSDQSSSWQESGRQSSDQQGHSQFTSQASSQHQTMAQGRTADSRTTDWNVTFGTGQPSRRTSAQPGVCRSPSYVTPSSGQTKAAEQSSSSITTAQGGTFKDNTRGGGFGEGVRRTSLGTETKAGLSRGGGFSSSQKAEISHPDAAGTSPRSSQRPAVSEPRIGRNATPSQTTFTSGPQRSSPVQQEQRRTVENTQARRTAASELRPGRNTVPPTSTPSAGPQRSSLVQQEQRRTVESTQTTVNRSTIVPQSGTAGKGATHSMQRPVTSEPRVSRNTPPATSMSMPGAQRPSPVRQEQRQTVSTDRPLVSGSGPVSRPGMAGTTTPPATKMSGTSAPGSQPGTAGTPTRSTRRPPVTEPRLNRNTPPVTSAPASGAHRSSAAQQEPSRTSGKGKPPVKNGGSVSHPGMAGTTPGSRTPPGQKLSGGPQAPKPKRQTKRGGPADV